MNWYFPNKIAVYQRFAKHKLQIYADRMCKTKFYKNLY